MGEILSQTPPRISPSRFSWHFSRFILPRLGWWNAACGKLTVWDSFGTPGDTLSAGTVCREIRRRFPRVKINCVTPNPELLRFDPAIDTLNGPPGPVVLRFWYLGLVEQKDPNTNVLAPSLGEVGITEYEYRARFFLSTEEREQAGQLLAGLVNRPFVTLNTQSREKVKTWSPERWEAVVQSLSAHFDIVQLGAADEPEIPGAIRLAGQLSIRESVAVLARAELHLGVVSFLMHAANGVNVPAVIVYGGRETPANSGYRENINLYVRTECSPCWLHDSRGDRCSRDMECMRRIAVEDVLAGCRELLRRKDARPLLTLETQNP